MKLTPLLLALVAFTAAAFAEVKVTEQSDLVRVEIDGQLFTEYHFTGARRPYLYPVIGPTGAGMTRNWPLKEGVPGEETDHPHHKGLWFGHRSVNGVGFWEDSGKPGTKLGQMVHDGFLEVKGGKDEGVIRAKNKWVLDDGGEVLATDERTMRFHPVKDGRLLDFEITIKAGDKEVVFGDDKDGTMAIRVAETMRVEKGKAKGEKTAAKGEGHIVTSEGKKDGDAWGTKAAWCDYYGPVEGKTVGVAMFDNPANPRFPTWWHVRTYGLFAANPFGQAQFEKLADKEAGAFKIAPGQSATFRYRFYFHEGDAEQAKVAEHYRDYTAKTK
ncbi:MAG: PmoA family protein [Chthoniobacteraceae bacterium]